MATPAPWGPLGRRYAARQTTFCGEASVPVASGILAGNSVGPKPPEGATWFAFPPPRHSCQPPANLHVDRSTLLVPTSFHPSPLPPPEGSLLQAPTERGARVRLPCAPTSGGPSTSSCANTCHVWLREAACPPFVLSPSPPSSGTGTGLISGPDTRPVLPQDWNPTQGRAESPDSEFFRPAFASNQFRLSRGINPISRGLCF